MCSAWPTAYLKPSNRTIGEFIPDAKPDRAEIPAKTDLAAALKDYKGEAAMAAGEAFDPSPKNIESRTERFTLPSGMKVVAAAEEDPRRQCECRDQSAFWRCGQR